jgi:hypothetical protein
MYKPGPSSGKGAKERGKVCFDSGLSKDLQAYEIATRAQDRLSQLLGPLLS